MKNIFELLAKKILSLRKPSEMDHIRQKQMLLNPAGSAGKLTEEYYIKKLSTVLIFIFAGLLISLFVWIADLNKMHFIDGNVLERNGNGEGERTVNLDIYAVLGSGNINQ